MMKSNHHDTTQSLVDDLSNLCLNENKHPTLDHSQHPQQSSQNQRYPQGSAKSNLKNPISRAPLALSNSEKLNFGQILKIYQGIKLNLQIF